MRVMLAAMCWFVVGCGEVLSPPPDAPGCEPGMMMCGDSCVAIDTPEHCGGCSACNLENATASCVQGQCKVASCAAGFCDVDGVGGCEAQPDFQTDFDHCGSCDGACISGICAAGVCSRRIFITANTIPAAFGGLTGGDSICQTEAQQHTFGGTWKVWAADGTNGPANRFTTHGAFIRASDHVVLANDFTELTGPALQNPVLKLADGTTPAVGFCWTNVAVGGGAANVNPAASCTNWTSTASAGQGGARSQHNLTSGLTGVGGSQNCDPTVIAPARLYCVEQ